MLVGSRYVNASSVVTPAPTAKVRARLVSYTRKICRQINQPHAQREGTSARKTWNTSITWHTCVTLETHCRLLIWTQTSIIKKISELQLILTHQAPGAGRRWVSWDSSIISHSKILFNDGIFILLCWRFSRRACCINSTVQSHVEYLTSNRYPHSKFVELIVCVCVFEKEATEFIMKQVTPDCLVLASRWIISSGNHSVTHDAIHDMWPSGKVTSHYGDSVIIDTRTRYLCNWRIPSKKCIPYINTNILFVLLM